MMFAPSYIPPVRVPRIGPLRAREDAIARRIRFALLNGPLALKGHRYQRTLLVERCEEIPGADVRAVRSTLRAMIEVGLVRTDGVQYWRAA